MKLGSLFDGIGGFPLPAQRSGIPPVWASEIEKAPIAITARHFPDMRHLGDITKISGADIEPVDIITFGSPCQDLSVAGKGAGLSGERSGLFREAVRIIREMRSATDGVFPRFAVWENVPGAFTSNGGEDFRQVLSELAETEISIPQSGRWANAGMVELADRQIAWRVLDAQYWGVPQRRKRVFLVADFRGKCAGEILFKPEGVRGDFEKGGEAGEETAGNTGASINPANCLTPWDNESRRIFTAEGIAPTLSGCDGGGGRNPAGLIFDCRGNGNGKTASTITGDHPNRVTDYTTIVVKTSNTKANGSNIGEDVAFTLDGGSNQAVMVMAHGQANAEILNNLSPTLNCNHEQPIVFPAIANTLLARTDSSPNAQQLGAICWNHYAVRRLTPLECERLQGFEDNWTAGYSDTARYKAIGNSVAIPCVEFIMRRIAEVLNETYS